jgi:hypothetical protein
MSLDDDYVHAGRVSDVYAVFLMAQSECCREAELSE